jgi:hypothetical protein
MVKRLNLIYADESRLAFSYRLRQARKRRDEVSSSRQQRWSMPTCIECCYISCCDDAMFPYPSILSQAAC